MPSLFTALKQYLRDAAPGGVLSPEAEPVAQYGRNVRGRLRGLLDDPAAFAKSAMLDVVPNSAEADAAQARIMGRPYDADAYGKYIQKSQDMGGFLASMKTLFHTSGDPITKITKNGGRFDEFLSFSNKPYIMTGAPNPITYSMKIDDDTIIPASSLFYHEKASKLGKLAQKVAKDANVDIDTAEKLISQRKSIWDLVDTVGDSNALAEMDWDIQKAAAKAAKQLGYRGVSMPDEQGTVYMIDMLGQEKKLVEILKHTAVK